MPNSSETKKVRAPTPSSEPDGAPPTKRLLTPQHPGLVAAPLEKYATAIGIAMAPPANLRKKVRYG